MAPEPATGYTNVGTAIPYPPAPAALPSGPSYDANAALDSMGYRYAHAVNAQGQDVVVAVVDSGVGSHPLLVGAVLPGLDMTADTVPAYAGDGRIDLDGHGTAVAGLIAARGSDQWPSMIGVAPQSSILPIRVLSAITTDGTDPRVVSRAVRAAFEPPVDGPSGRAVPRIVNLSLAAAAPSAALADVVDTVRRQGALLIAAAGNDGMPEPDWPAAFAPQAGGHVIAVGAVDATGTMPTWSNRAGALRDHYLVAPGVDLLTTVPPGLVPPSAYGLVYASGTSFATPVVAGAAATVWGLWPYLKASEVSGILLDTARDLGAPGPDEVFGRGLLDLEAALKPVGDTVLPRAGGGWDSAVLATDEALARALRAQDVPVMVFDRYRRHFAVPLGRLVVSTHSRVGLSLPLGPMPAAVASPAHGLQVAGAWQVDALGRSRWQGGWRDGAEAWSWAFWQGQPLSAASDATSVARYLPGWAQVAYGGLIQDPGAIGLEGRYRAGRWVWSLAQISGRAPLGGAQTDRQLSLSYRGEQWRLAAHATVSDRRWWSEGWGRADQWGMTLSRQTAVGDWMVAWSETRAKQDLPAWQGDVQMVLQSVALGWQGKDVGTAGDRLALAVSRPLSLQQGQAVLNLPIDVNWATGQPRFATLTLPLRNGAAQPPLRLEALWWVPLGKGATFSAAAALSAQGGGGEWLIRYQRPF
ncbi:S8 family peptidase [Tepidimonas sp.]|uniref:S8 family peptidase n=1 Tax=Tepidimonas sp. TaxID=2002775 RepID=UPI002626743D|nr:S8 family peptidase [Tepidimonas sp.]